MPHSALCRPPSIWALLSSLPKSEFFSILLVVIGVRCASCHPRDDGNGYAAPPAGVGGCRLMTFMAMPIIEATSATLAGTIMVVSLALAS